MNVDGSALLLSFGSHRVPCGLVNHLQKLVMELQLPSDTTTLALVSTLSLGSAYVITHKVEQLKLPKLSQASFAPKIHKELSFASGTVFLCCMREGKAAKLLVLLNCPPGELWPSTDGLS